jgi:signal transduction histidine kinase
MWMQLLQGEVWEGTLTNCRKDGSLFEVDLTIAPVRDGTGEIANYVAVYRDITERKHMVETLQRAVMVKTEFTSMVSHELRTPLSAIKEAIDVVEDGTAGPLNKHQENFLALAKRNVDRLHRLINDTLDFSRLERGEFRLRVGRSDLNAIVGEVVLQQRLAAKKRGLQLELSLDDSLPPVRLDPDRVSQVLVNLISNAIRYCEGSWIEVSTERKANEVILKVQDSGPGIPEEQLQDIFHAFVQLSTGPGRRVGGTGLGLAISKQIVELHGGRIWVESEVGSGSAFYFSLQLDDEALDVENLETGGTNLADKHIAC